MKRSACSWIIVFAALGLLISGYLTQRHYALTEGIATEPSFCSISEALDCDRVNLSEYAVLFGIPLSSIGFAYYLALMWLAFVVGFLGKRLSPEIRSDAIHWMLLMTLTALIVGVYFLGVSIFALQTFCLLCLATYAINALSLLLVWKSRPKQLRPAAEKGTLIFWTGLLVAVGVNLPIMKYWQAERANDPGKSRAALLPEREKAPSGTQREELKQRMRRALGPQMATIDPQLYEGPSKGAQDAEFTIVEFSDFECPHCRQAAEVTRSLLAAYGDRVRVVFKHFPLNSECNPHVPTAKHEKACLFAAAATCAFGAEAGRFWDMHDLLFEKGASLDREKLLDLAGRIGLDERAFAQCLDSAETSRRIAHDTALGKRIGVRGVPTHLVNGRLLEDYRLLAPEHFAMLSEVLREPEN